MQIRWYDEAREKQYEYDINTLIINRSSRENKGYMLYSGTAAARFDSQRMYFIKFVKLDGSKESEIRRARQAFWSESRFKVRYPYIAYVEGCAEGELVLEEGDAYALRVQEKELDRLAEGGNRILCLFEELVEGEDLEEIYSIKAKPVPEERMFQHMRQLVYGMCAYMSQNKEDMLIHRDIKPANIRVSGDGRTVKYIDFDWSHVSRSMKTQYLGRAIGGTPGYLDPRLADSSIKKSDSKMDIYSLAMVFLYMMLGEEYIFDIRGAEDNSYLENKEMLYQLRRSYLKRNGKPVYQEPQYDGLRKIIAKMMAKPEKRYQKPESLLHDLEKFFLNYYGKERYRQLFSDEVLLTGTVYEESDWVYLVCLKQNQKEKVKIQFKLAANQVIELTDLETEKQPVMMIYLLDGQVFCIPLCNDFEVLEGDGKQLTTDGSKFKMNGELFTLKVRLGEWCNRLREE